MSDSPSPAGNTTTTQQTNPWEGSVPYILGTGATYGTGPAAGIFPMAATLYNSYTPQYFPDSTVAGFTPTQQAGLTAETNLGTTGSSAVNTAGDALSWLNSGGALSAGNPYFSSMASNVLSQVVPGIESTFAGGNNMNNPAAAFATSQGATSALGSLAYQNYNDQLDNMIKSAALSPAQQQAQYQNVGALLDAGTQEQQQNQAQLNDQINRFNYQQQLPYNLLQMYENEIMGANSGSSGLSTQPYFGPSTGSQIAQGVGTAAQLAGTIALLASL